MIRFYCMLFCWLFAWSSIQAQCSFSGLQTEYCISDAPSTLTANTVGGSYNGPGIIGNSFDPALAGPGLHSIKYTIGNNIALNDEDYTAALPIGFGFEFFGNTYNDFYISSNGFISFTPNQSPGCCSGQSIPNVSAPNNLIAFAWEDLNPNAGGSVRYATVGSAPNRTLVVEFDQIPHYGSSSHDVAVQIHLHEGSNLIEIHSLNMPGDGTADGDLHTQGIENSNGTIAFYAPNRNQEDFTLANDYISFTPISATQYSINQSGTVNMMNISGTCTSKKTVLVHALPQVQAAASSPSLCDGDSLTLTANGDPATYSWDNAVLNGQRFLPLSTTTYSVTATDVNGCQSTTSVQIPVNPLPQVQALASSKETCYGDSLTLTGSGDPATYSWDNGVMNNSTFIPSTTLTYHLTATDANGCQNFADTTVVVHLLPTVTAHASANTICQGDTISLFGSGSTATHSWGTNNAPIIQVAPTANQDYIITARDVNSCESKDTISITVNALPNIIAMASRDTICMGDALLLFGSGTSNSYTWDQGVMDSTSTTLTQSNTFHVIGTDANGCQNDDSIYIHVNPLPTIGITASQLAICQGESVILSATGAQNFSWNNGVIDGQSFQPSTTQNYSVLATDVNGCMNTADTTIVVNPLPTINILSAQNQYCEGDSARLLAYGSTATYTWNNGVQQAVDFPITLGSTIYIVEAVDNLGCSKKDSITLTGLAKPTIQISSNVNNICPGDSATLSVQGALHYTWSNGSNTSNTVVSPTQNTVYFVEASDQFSCTTRDSILVEVLARPQVIASASSMNICSGDAVQLSAQGALQYTWSNGVTNGQNFTPLSTATYTVSGTDGNGCENTDTVTVTVSQSPTIQIQASQQVLCEGDSLTLLAIGNATQYNWNHSVQQGSPFLADPAISTYIVQASNQGNCQTSDTIQIAFKPRPIVDAASNLAQICEGDSVRLFGRGNASMYNWNNGVQNNSFIKATVNQTYIVEGIDHNGCSSIDTLQLIVNAKPPVQANTNIQNNSICEGESLILSGSGAVAYVWTNQVQDNVAFSPSSTQTYIVEGISQNSCVNYDTIHIEVLDKPMVQATVDKDSICLGKSVTFKAVGNGQNYDWNAGISDASPYAPIQSQYYTVEATAPNGCKQTDSIFVTVLQQVNLQAQASASVVCPDDLVQLNAIGSAVSYTWSHGKSNNTDFTILQSTTYHVTATDANGCEARDSVLITVRTPLPINATASKQYLCPGELVTLEGQNGSNYSWNMGIQNGQAFRPSQNQQYTLSGLDANGCMSLDTISVFLVNNPQLQATASKLAICPGETVQLQAQGATQYNWINLVGTQPNVSPSQSQSYTVSGINQYGCSDTTSVFIQVRSLPTVQAQANASAVCEGDSVQLSATGAVQYNWNQVLINGQAQVLAPQTFIVKGTDMFGCQNTDTITVGIHPSPSIQVNLNDTSICAGESIVLSATGTPSISWDAQITNGLSFAPQATRIYNVTGTDQNGCTAYASATVTVNQATIPQFVNLPQELCDTATIFELEALPQGGIFSGLGMQNQFFDPTQHGIGRATVEYSFTDQNGCTGSTVKGFDVVDCKTVNVNKVDDNNKIKYYPNPTSSYINIAFEKQLMNGQVRLSDISGKVLQQLTVEQSDLLEINIEEYPAAIYFIQVYENGQLIGQEKVLKLRN